MTASVTAAYDRLLRRSVLGVGPYVPGAGARETKARLGRDDLIRLNWNENPFGPLDGVLAETTAALHAAWIYPEEAYEAFRYAVAAWTGADPAQVIPGHGIQALTLALVSAFVESGDAVVIPRPTYGLYAQACAAAGATVHRVDAPRPSLAFDLDAIAHAARETGAKLVWICDPNNPTGLRLEGAEWAGFLDALPPRCLAVADEAYVDYVERADRIDRLTDIRAGRPVVVLRTFSKIFGLAGLRLGYLLVHEALAPHINAVQEPFNVNLAALAAGQASLRRADELPARADQVRHARERLTAPLQDGSILALASDANFVLLDIGADDRIIADQLAAAGLLVRPGTEFGLPGFIRVTTAGEDMMDRVAESLLALSL
jgi:histidinol-phosphate aminotransferase